MLVIQLQDGTKYVQFQVHELYFKINDKSPHKVFLHVICYNYLGFLNSIAKGDL